MSRSDVPRRAPRARPIVGRAVAGSIARTSLGTDDAEGRLDWDQEDSADSGGVLPESRFREVLTPKG